MQTKLARMIKILLIVTMLLILSGCFKMTAEELYSMPKLSERYSSLQKQIDQFFIKGAEYSAPAGGTNRSAAQLHDLNGDGVDEALVFLKVSGSEKPLKIVIFSYVNEAYEISAQIEGEGSNIDSIDYADMDNDGILEVIVGWQLSGDVRMLNVYSIRGFQVMTLVSTDYLGYTVYNFWDKTEGQDLIVLRHNSVDITGNMTVYGLMEDGEVLSSYSELSQGIASLSRIRTSKLLDGSPAVFVESVLQTNEYVTDIFVCGEQCTNITKDPVTGISSGTLRSYNVYCRDLDGDGVLDVPYPIQVTTANETSNYWLIGWYAYRSSSIKSLMLMTYHNYSDGWYLEIPQEWDNGLSIRREDGVSGERAIVFSIENDDGEPVDFLTIYALTGENRYDKAESDGRILLDKTDDVVYAAKIMSDFASTHLYVNAEMVKEYFHIIYSEWKV